MKLTRRNIKEGNMDASVKKLLAELKKAEDLKWRVSMRVRTIHEALKLIGVKPDTIPAAFNADLKESEYTTRQTFKNLSLAETCEKILKDYVGNWLTRSQVEYLATRGGYDFSTKNPGNSVDVTLRRMAGAGKIEADRIRGSRGSKYRWIPEPAEAKKEVVGSYGLKP
jgi:hypothetical protein